MKNKVLAFIILFILVMSSFQTAVFAENKVFAIDNEHIYDGMEKSYSNGYSPKVTDEYAEIILPLLANNEIKDSKVTASLDLGQADDSPFVYGSYINDFFLSDYEFIVNEAETERKSAYLIDFKIPLAKKRYNGNYAVTVHIEACDMNNELISEDYPFNISITNGKNRSSGTSTPKAEKPKPNPMLILTGYSVVPENPKAGETFEVKVTLKNTSAEEYIGNVLINATIDNDNISILDSKPLFFEKIESDGEISFVLKCVSEMEADSGKNHINLNYRFDTKDAVTLNDTAEIEFRVKHEPKVEVIWPELDNSYEAGTNAHLAFQVLNTGRCSIYNARMEIDVPGFQVNSVPFIGNIDAGTAADADCNIFIGMLPGNPSYGYTSGRMTLIYEDENGEEIREGIEVGAVIDEPYIRETGEEEKKADYTVWYVGIGILVAVIAGLVAVAKKRRKK